MRKKNLSVKVAALAMSGTLAMAPMTVRADEAAVAPVAASPAASTTTPAAESSATVSGTPATATGGATTSAPTIVTVTEDPADPGTTAPNNANKEDHVDHVVENDKQGTDIHFKADGEVKTTLFGAEITIPVHKDYNAEIKPEDTKDDKKLKDTVQEFKYTDLGKLKNNDLVMHGDLSIQKDGDTTPFDSTSDKAKDVEKKDTFTLKADLDRKSVV